VLQAANDTISCIIGLFELDFSACGALINLTSEQEACFEGCNALPACLGQLCLKTRPTLAVAIIPTCSEGDICISGAQGYCCPRGYPNVCPASFSGDCPSYEAGCPPEDYRNFCCAHNAECVVDTTNGAVYGYSYLPLCCPKDQVCGTKTEVTNGIGGKFPIFEGTCCGPGNVCAKSMVPGRVGKPECCDPKSIRNGNCCDGKWCGDQCCPGECDGNKCGTLCLNGYTTDGKCCPSGVACGTVCCSASCADAATSTCGSGNKVTVPK
jgi:hypothetical protein